MITNERLIEHLILRGVLKTPRIIEAFESMDRIYFVPDELEFEAYVDAPLPIGNGQTISQPYTVAFMLELLDAKEGDFVLDIGSGSGWTTALLSKIVGDTGEVTGIERVEELVRFGQNNLEKLKLKNCTIEKATETIGKPVEKFDKILVSASAQDFPEELIGQLNIGGRIVIPIFDAIYCFEKISEYELDKQVYPGFVFVPLIY